MIDERYPTLTDRAHTFIAGSSMGGLMSLYAVIKYNDVFSRAACLSPSLWTAPWRVNDLVQRAKLIPDTVIYMDYGSREMGNRKAMRKLFASVTARLMEKKVWLTSRIVPNGDHCEACWEEQIPVFMNVLEYHRD
jgi:predicted alpha/beta superfamily hydrolase